MKRMRIEIACNLAHYHRGRYEAYKQAMEMLVELPHLYEFSLADTGLVALEAHQVNIEISMEEEFRHLVVAVSVYCGTNHSVDVDSADNFRVVFMGPKIYALLAFRQQYEMPVLGSLKNPRFPRVNFPLII